MWHAPSLPRRQWLRGTCCGFGALALHDLARAASDPTAARLPGVTSPKARRVIFLFMAGGPSQPDLFDPKEAVRRAHGTTIAPPVDPTLETVGIDKYLALAPIAPIRPRGQSGTLVSDLMPHLAGIADDICLLRGMHADNNQHAPATLQFHTGSVAEARPSMGAWIGYGLGTDNETLPGFVTVHPDADVRTYGAAFLPAKFQGTKISAVGSTPIDNLADPTRRPAVQRARIDFVQELNRRLLAESQADDSDDAASALDRLIKEARKITT